MALDLSGIKEAKAWEGGSILGPGWHNVTIDQSDEGTSSGGYPQIELEMANNEGSIRDWVVVIPSTLGKVKQVLEACGIEDPEVKAFDPSVLVGKRCRIHVKEEPRRDDPTKTRTVIDAYTPWDATKEGTDVPSDGDDIPF